MRFTLLAFVAAAVLAVSAQEDCKTDGADGYPKCSCDYSRADAVPLESLRELVIDLKEDDKEYCACDGGNREAARGWTQVGCKPITGAAIWMQTWVCTLWFLFFLPWYDEH